MLGSKQEACGQIAGKGFGVVSVHRCVPLRLAGSRPVRGSGGWRRGVLQNQGVVNIRPGFLIQGVVYRNAIIHGQEAAVLHPEVLLPLVPVFFYFSNHVQAGFSRLHLPGNALLRKALRSTIRRHSASRNQLKNQHQR